jgi:hypothetical protein
MRFNKIILPVILIISSLFKAEAQSFVPPSSSLKICYAGDKVTRIYIPPPAKSSRAKGSKGAAITVTYTGFNPDAKAAMEYAVSILSSILPTDINIYVKASWIQMTDASILGSTGVTVYYKGSFFDAINPDVYYPVALAEKIAGKGLNVDTDPDISMSLNSKISWYTGTDGKTPVDKYDLVTVILHEMCHGLGFNESMNSNDTIGWYGFNSVPEIFDTFIENFEGRKLIDTKYFNNYSTDLYSQLTGNNIYFNGPLLSNYTSGNRATLYAPSKWKSGSSISHLDEYRTLPVNAMMTPFINKAEAIHDPGKLTMSILGDVGWINTKLYHTPFRDTEQNPGHFDFNVRIKSDTLFNKDMVGLVYSFDNFATDDTLFLPYNPVNDTFSIALNIPVSGTRISYYFFTKDYFNRIYRLPSTGSKIPYVFYVGTDTVKPQLSHIPLDYFFNRIDTILFSSRASDNIGIDSVYIEYKINAGNTRYLRLKNDSLDYYTNFLRIAKGSIKAGDSIQYKVIAIDKANLVNQKKMPATGYYIIHIEATGEDVDSYVTDFSGSASDFVNRGFSVIQPANFTSPALHTRHPYESPEISDKSIEYTSVLRHPITVDATGMIISFKEIVLVEPGEPRSVFGSPDFYDYVIVEGSKNFGKTWFWLINGYDSRMSTVFESAYNSSFNGMNSTATGREDMYSRHTINISSSAAIVKGDTLMVRFRLFSDPYANGWGWAIDDLSIKSVASPVEKVATSDVKVFPNPGSGRFTLDTRGFTSGKKLNLSILNSTGVKMTQIEITSGSENMIDISGFPSGIYILVINDNRRISSIKYCLTGN